MIQAIRQLKVMVYLQLRSLHLLVNGKVQLFQLKTILALIVHSLLNLLQQMLQISVFNYLLKVEKLAGQIM